MSWLDHWFRTELSEEQIYKNRKTAFVAELDTRQAYFYDHLNGASQTEVILLLEARLYDLEQEVRRLKEAPVLTDVVLPAKPKSPRKPGPLSPEAVPIPIAPPGQYEAPPRRRLPRNPKKPKGDPVPGYGLSDQPKLPNKPGRKVK